MNGDQVQRELGNLDARVAAGEARQSKTDKVLDKILERLRAIEVRVAVVVALLLAASEVLRWVIRVNG